MLIAVDTETTGLDRAHGCRPFMVTAFDEEGNEYLWQWEVDPFKRKVRYDADDLYEIRQLCMNNTVIWHNAKFDVGMLAQVGCLDWDFLRQQDSHDTAIMAHMFNNLELSFGLKSLAKKYIGISTDDEKDLKAAVTAARREAKKLEMRYAVEGEPTMPAQKGKHTGADYWLPRAIAADQDYPDDHPWWDVCSNYAVADVVRTLKLYQFYQEALHDLGRLDHYERRRALLAVLFDMEVKGVTVLPERMRELKLEYEAESERYEKQAKGILKANGWPNAAKLNIDSHDQMREILYNDDGFKILPQHFTKGSKPATHVQALTEIMDCPENEGPIRDFLLSTMLHRKHQKAAGDLASYMQFEKDGVLFYNLNITGTSTTRFSAYYPNTQNISKGENPLQEFLERALTMRYVFGPRPGRVWFAIDYRQLQLFIFAYITDERTLVDALVNGADAHDYVARKIFDVPDDEEPTKGQRRIAKNVNFGFIFGASSGKIGAISGRGDLWTIVTKLFPNAHAYIQQVIETVRTGGEDRRFDWRDSTLFLRFTEGEDIDDDPGYPLQVPHSAPYSGVNYQVQGLEGIIVQEAMRRVDAYLREEELDAFITLMIHDELVIDCPEDIDPQHIIRIGEIMREAGQVVGMDLQTSCEIITDNLGEGSEWEPTETVES